MSVSSSWMPSSLPDMSESKGNESDGTQLRTQLRTQVDEAEGTKLRPQPDASDGTQLRETRAFAKPGDTVIHGDVETALSASHEDMTVFELAQPPVALSP